MTGGQVDEMDRQILEMLAADSRIDEHDIASDLSIDGDEVSERIAKLEEERYIKRYSTVLDPVKIGFGTWTYHYANLGDYYEKELEIDLEPISQWKAPQLAFVTFGEYDLIFRKLSDDLAEANNFSTNLINHPKLPEYDNIETYEVTERFRWRGQRIPDNDRELAQKRDLDDIELKVLKELVRDSRLKDEPERIANSIGVTPGEVTKAISTLESGNVILGYSIDLDLEKMGLRRAIVGADINRDHYESVVDQLLEIDPITIPYIHSGFGFHWQDLGIEVVFETLDEIHRVTDQIRTLEGVGSSRTMIGAREYHHEPQIDLNHYENLS